MFGAPGGRLTSAIPRTVALLAVASLSVAAGACATNSDSAGGGQPTAPGSAGGDQPRGTTPTAAGPADGAPTTTGALDAPPSTAVNVSPAAVSGGGSCQAATLVAELEEDAGEPGHQHRRLILTNSGPEACTMTGYPGIALRDPAGRPLGAPASREPLPVATVTLAPGASASAAIDQQSPGVFPPAECGTPAPVGTVQVIAPDDTSTLTVTAWGEACPNPVDQLSVRPLQAGRDSQP
jgi:hypothetical protein